MNASLAAPGLHRHTVADYYRMAETGILPRDARVELIEGTIFDRAPIGISHASVVDRLGHLLTQATAGKAIVRVQNPVRLNTFSEPQPDLALLRWREDLLSSDVAKVWMVKQGQTLASIAAVEYGDPREWRTIAEANVMDDPLAMVPGRSLILPARRVAWKRALQP